MLIMLIEYTKFNYNLIYIIVKLKKFNERSREKDTLKSKHRSFHSV